MHRLRSASAVAAGLAVVVAAVAGSGILTARAASVVNDLGQLLGGIAATALTALHRSGAELRWRLLMAAGFLGWSGRQALWTWSQVISLDAIPSPSLADVGYLTLPVFALLVLAAAGRQRSTGRSETSAGRGRCSCWTPWSSSAP